MVKADAFCVSFGGGGHQCLGLLSMGNQTATHFVVLPVGDPTTQTDHGLRLLSPIFRNSTLNNAQSPERRKTKNTSKNSAQLVGFDVLLRFSALFETNRLGRSASALKNPQGRGRAGAEAGRGQGESQEARGADGSKFPIVLVGPQNVFGFLLVSSLTTTPQTKITNG